MPLRPTKCEITIFVPGGSVKSELSITKDEAEAIMNKAVANGLPARLDNAIKDPATEDECIYVNAKAALFWKIEVKNTTGIRIISELPPAGQPIKIKL